MEFTVIFLLCLLSSASWVSSKATPSNPVLYWKSELPNTPIPHNILSLLRTANHGSSYRATGEGGIATISPKSRTCCFCNYHLCMAKAQVNPDPAFVFFPDTDLQKGKTMTLDLTKSTNSLPFLPRSVADSIPFSLEKFPEILHRFSVAPNSLEADTLKSTLEQCNAVEENSVCATSLESIADFVKTKLGNGGRVISTVSEGMNKVQRYRIVEVSKKLNQDEEETEPVVSCHKMNYAYAVFNCHKAVNIKAYAVNLVGEDETELKAVAVCHTSESRPGVCHFLPEDHFLVYNN